ncbi:MAG: class I SAM-dependent methyltransferase [Acidimicrobiia bacterium]
MDYGPSARTYPRYRQPDPRLAACIHEAIGPAPALLNVGAGAGAYEPGDRRVTAVEPSAAMRAQRPPAGAGQQLVVVAAVAEALPFTDGSFDAAMTTFSVHQWPDPVAGLREVRRVTTGPVAVLTCDPARLGRWWLADYAPEVIATEARRYPPLDLLAAALGSRMEVHVVPVPLDCTDGFNEAYYGRPERLLDPAARQACSAWGFLDPAAEQRFAATLARDLRSGRWDDRHGHLRHQPSLDGSLMLCVAR